MFCCQCGKPIDEHAQYCRFCGAKQTPVNKSAYNDGSAIPSDQPIEHTQVINVVQASPKTNATCVFGFILSIINLFYWLYGVAFIVSLIGLHRSNRRGEKGQGFAIAGILLTAIPFLLGVANGIATYSG